MHDSKVDGAHFLVHYLGLDKYKAIYAVSMGAFLTLFLLAFQPFGVTNYDPNFHLTGMFLGIILTFGCVVAASLLLSHFLLRPLLLPAPSATQMGIWLGFDLWLISTLSFFLYNYMGDWHDLHWLSYLGFVRDICMATSFPMVGFVFYIRHESLRSEYVRLRATALAPPSTKLVLFTSENEKDNVAVALGDLLFLESQDNYVAVVYMDQGQRRTSLIRSTLKRIETAVNEPQLLRCHRSFIINLQRVRSCQGNQHGLKLQLEGVEQILPVSRAYTQTVLEQLGPMQSGAA